MADEVKVAIQSEAIRKETLGAKDAGRVFCSPYLTTKVADGPAIPVVTREQLLFLGRENLEYLKKKWEEMRTKAAPMIQRQQELMDLTDNTSLAELLTEARKYDDPQYESCKSRYADEKVMPADPEADRRVMGSTTLNICGWCRYALSCGYPYSRSRVPNSQRAYRPSCALWADEWDVTHACDYNHECILTHPKEGDPAPAEFFRQMRARYVRYLEMDKNVMRQIGLLDELIAEAVSKPLLSKWRSLEHYAKDTEVFWFYVDNSISQPESYPFDPVCNLGEERTYCKVGRGAIIGHTNYQYVKGLVLVRFENGRETRIDYDNALLIAREDLKYLAGHPDYAQVWLMMADDSKVGCVADVLAFYREHHYFPVD